MLPHSSTMADVARLAGVHRSTVSRALRDDPRITPDQREQIKAAAAQLGYRTNPLVAALMSARRSRQEPLYRATLGFVTKYPRERAAWFAREFGPLLQGATERAHAQGYHLEEFNGHEHTQSPARLSEILQHRGIHGLIIAPLHSIHDTVQLDWTKFGAIAVGYSLREVALSRVAHNHFTGLALAAQQARTAGHERLGLVLPRRVVEKVGKRWLAAFYLDQAEHSPSTAVPPLLFEEENEAEFRAWFTTHRPTALLCLNAAVLQGWLANIKVPAGCPAVISLDRRPRDRGITGVDQDYARLGAAAADAVIGLLHRNEQGLPPKPFTLLLDGTWIDGRSLTPLTSGAKRRLPRTKHAPAPA